ncbi:Probable beta-hexosaminidase fdl; AltName: Full=Protein fused lobes; Flags: Precursor [Serendipita indica DSM 11827]|uniref:beta-N-acetylhexosaminidase n=1 Tax=Serendipita indica (strain DSM 11827) TaxID=1109443 RepID=G4THP2_SERID|nr:Probable beta-hexosaminidase fdl; AltName: Full=Protein fused lobes; Flags: Precursor [Serendipita indica DSM 11827]CCA70832.1 probable exochitinase [Serendipita indica DSM 11827]
MKESALILVFACFFSITNALWPIPRHLQSGSTALTLANEFRIDTSSIHGVPQDLYDAVGRTMTVLKHDHMQRLVVGRGPGDDVDLGRAQRLKRLALEIISNTNHNRSMNEGDGNRVMVNPLVIHHDHLLENTENDIDSGGTPYGFPHCEIYEHDGQLHKCNHLQSIAANTALPAEERDESYTLTVPSDGSEARLRANTTLGLLRGLTTFSQMWYTWDNWTYTVEAPFEILDEPYYKWRGLLLDTARNFFPIGDIKRTISAMELTKMNIFHWHIVDSQSFPLNLPDFPELVAKGAYSSSKQYSTKDLDDVISFAAARGVDVMLEIDTPGHTAAIHHSHPEYIACFEKTPWTTYANEPPAGQLRLTEPTVVNFTQRLFSSTIKHTPGKYFSTGGDEINRRCYEEDPVVNKTLTESGKTFEQALATFTNRTHEVLVKAGKKPVVWQEMVLDHGDLGLHKDTVVLVWISSADAKAVVEKGFKIVHAPSDYFYLDCGHGAWVGAFPDGNSWCDPFKTWQKAYSFDPLANLTTTQSTLVLGGQQLLWAEQSDPFTLDSTLWPRAAASAELFWTGPTHPNGQKPNVKEALPRLHDLRGRMVQRGIQAVALQPEYCALRPHACDLV